MTTLSSTDLEKGTDKAISVRLTVRSGAVSRNVLVSAGANATVAAVASALARHLGVAGAGRLYGARTGALAPESLWAAAGLLDGETVSLTLPEGTRPAGGAEDQPVAELVIVGGPESGKRVALVVGKHIVGRDPAATIRLDDASLSRRHLVLQVEEDGQVWLTDEGSANGTAIGGVGLSRGERRIVLPTDHIEAGRSMLAARPWRPVDVPRASTTGSPVMFNRPPRVARTFEPPRLSLEEVPRAGRRVRVPAAITAGPTLMALVLWLASANAVFLLISAGSPLLVLASYAKARRDGRKNQQAAHAAAADALAADLAAAGEAELAERRVAAPDAAQLARRAQQRSPDLWQRRPSDNDFLDVRIGLSDQEARTTVETPTFDDAELRGRVDEMLAQRSGLPSAPVTVSLGELGVLGLTGEFDQVDALARWLIVQVATLHSPRDLVIAAVLSPRRADRWGWLGWLPHTSSPGSPVDGRHIAVGTAASRDLIRQLAILARERRDEDAERFRARRRTTIVVLVDDEVAPERAIIDELLDGCAEIGLIVIWLARDRQDLPVACGALIELALVRAVANVIWTRTGRAIPSVSVDGIPQSVADEVARSLSPVVDVTASGVVAELPRFVPLVRLMDLVGPTSDQIAQRWTASRNETGLRAVIGAAADEPFSVDLRAHGPHALVAGTTGAGKSELLRTLIIALAASHPPDRLAFVLVDFKGGAAFGACANLPHTTGILTDLDDNEARRALISLSAELQRREEILHKAGASDFSGLERTDPGIAPPSLVIVIDEFATLAKESSEFLEGMVSIAQRGRTLGLHLVFATQRPSGVVTSSIRANTHLRISLRVAGPADSDDVIGSPEAAALPRSAAGRAVARVGTSELIPFQVGYVGGRTRPVGNSDEISVRDLDFGVPVTEAAEAVERDPETDLDLLAMAISTAAEQQDVARAHAPWLPPLPHAIGLADASEIAEPDWVGDDSRAVVGVIDDPGHQRRSPWVVDLTADGSLLVYGTTGSGKTTVLRTIAISLAGQCSPDELHIYGMDFGARGLAALAELPHCGSVIPGEDEERISRLLSILRNTIDRRAREFAASGSSTLAAHRQARPDLRVPRVLVLLDSYAGFFETYERVDLGTMVDALPRLVADGGALGVHFVIAADRRGTVPSSLSSLVTRRLILRMANDDEYPMLGLHHRAVSGTHMVPGRGFDHDGREVQFAVVGGTSDGRTQLDALAETARRIAAIHTARAPAIDKVPLIVDRASLPLADEPLHAVVGVDALDLAPLTLSVEEKHVIVIGPYRSGRTTALGTLTRSLQESTPSAQMHLLAPRRSALTALDGWTSVSRDPNACNAQIQTLLDEIMGRDDESDDPLIVVVLDDAGELTESVAAPALEVMLKRGRDRRLRVVAGIETGQARHYASWVRELRKDGHGLLLSPDPDADGELLGVRLPRHAKRHQPPGRGYYVDDGRVRLVQVARDMPDD
jgi:S-DNA-T family DNA segregation ATPase FtsK/SpoIIIE